MFRSAQNTHLLAIYSSNLNLIKTMTALVFHGKLQMLPCPHPINTILTILISHCKFKWAFQTATPIRLADCYIFPKIEVPAQNSITHLTELPPRICIFFGGKACINGGGEQKKSRCQYIVVSEEIIYLVNRE